MKCIFMGTPDFAAVCLEKLASSRHEVLAVFSQPDKPVGRKQQILPTAVKACAMQHGIPVYQPPTLKDSSALAQINQLQPDIIIVVAYGKILPTEILHAAKYGCVNEHASLLPKYRGAAPIQWAVLNGDRQTGVCIMQMDAGLDTGDILYTVKTDIGPNETSAELFDRLAVLGADALLKTLDLIESGEAVLQKQPQGDGFYASRITKDMAPIDWSRSAAQIHNQIRGLQTWPCAQTTQNGRVLKLHTSRLTPFSGGVPGQVTEQNKHLYVTCGDGKWLEILELQPAGKKKMDAKSFLSGYPVQTDTYFGS